MKSDTPGHKAARADSPRQGKRKYEKPRLTDYGLVSKLTLTGGVSVRDVSSQKRPCL